MARAEDYAQWIVNNADKKGTPEFDTVAQAYQIAKQGSQHQVQSLDAVNGQLVPSGGPGSLAKSNPTDGMSNFQKFSAGYGGAAVDLGRGIGQTVGLVNRGDVADSRSLDAPLMDTTAGKWGHGIGTVADLAPAAFVPGANTYAGAAAIGAGTGLLMPSTSTGETLGNIAGGGAGGAGGVLAGRLLGVGYQAGKSMLTPLFKNGQEGIAARTLQGLAGPNASGIANDLTSNMNVLSGVQPTTAELTGNAGLAQLERTLRNYGDNASTFQSRDLQNIGAVKSAINDIAGTDADMAAATARRSNLTEPLYKVAKGVQVPADEQLQSLLQRPSMASAWGRAQKLAAEQGDSLTGVTKQWNAPDLAASGTSPTSTDIYSGKTIQYLKMALNDMINEGKQQGIGSHELGAVQDTLGSLNNWTSANVPEMRLSDQAYGTLSRPINRMELGSALRDKLIPALADFGNNQRLNANSFATSARDLDALAAKVTGWKGADGAQILGQDGMQTVQQIGEQLARRSNAAEAGRAAGSNTAQNLMSQDMLRQVLGPLGLPDNALSRAASSTFGQTLTRPAQFITKAGEAPIMDMLTEASLNPQRAAELLRMNANQAKPPAVTLSPFGIPFGSQLGATVANYLNN